MLATLLLQVPVDAATGPYKVHHFNMWARRHESTGGLNPATYAKNIIGTSKPMILTYNEICKSQYDTLASHLGSGYSKHFQTVVDDPPSCGSNEDFGIAIFIQGSWQEALSGIYNDQAAGDEVRRYYCIRTTFYAVPLVGCVTHLTNKSDPTASKQAGQLAYRMGLYWGSLYHFAGGDFNMTPTYMRGRTDGAQYWHQQYHESDRHTRHVGRRDPSEPPEQQLIEGPIMRKHLVAAPAILAVVLLASHAHGDTTPAPGDGVVRCVHTVVHEHVPDDAAPYVLADFLEDEYNAQTPNAALDMFRLSLEELANGPDPHGLLALRRTMYRNLEFTSLGVSRALAEWISEDDVRGTVTFERAGPNLGWRPTYEEIGVVGECAD